MFKLILYKELREIIGSTKFVATFGICSILIILAFFTGIKNYQAGMREYEASKAAQLQQFETITDWNRVTNHRIFLRPDLLACLVMGISNDIGRTATISGGGNPVISDSTYSEQPVFAVFRFLDLEFVFQIILSLFAILFAFDAINGEKERGTLRLSFANAVPRANYILGKLIGSFLALALPLLIPILVGMLLLPLTGLILSTDEWIRLCLFIISGLLYLGVFLTLSVFISCLTKRSSSSFLFLLVIWVCSVLIVPRGSVLLAGNMVEVPSMAKIFFQINQLERQISSDTLKRQKEFYKELFQEQLRNRADSPEARKKYQTKREDFFKKIMKEKNEKVQKFANLLNEERRNIQVKQEKLAFRISRVSPTAVFNLVATTLGGTSLELRTHFYKKAAAYSQSFTDFISQKTGHKIGTNRAAFNFNPKEMKKPPQPINPGEIPEFVYKSPELSVIFLNTLPDIAILILFNLIFFCGAFLAFLRYDLR